MILPVDPGPGSLSSAVLKFNVILCMMLLNWIFSESWLTVFGHRKLPDNFCEFMTPPIEDRLVVVCTENAPLNGVEAEVCC